MKTKTILPVVLFLFAGAAGFPASPEDFLGTEQAAVLRDRGSITEVQIRNPEPLLLPRYAEVRRLMEEARSALDPSLMVETLFLYEKPPGAGRPAWTERERSGLYNSTLALSTLTGLQYYSSSRKTMRTFYESSVVIDGPDSKRPLPDPVYLEPPAELALYARQKDLTFGDNIYRYDFYARREALIFLQRNLSPMNAGIIPAVGKEKLCTLTAVIDAGDYLLIYAVSLAKAASLPGMGQRISNSFTTRMEAVLGWFTKQADQVFK